uniref:Transmembrane protein 60-like n=1 Tax=Ciona intestinalis TaxID=7719 RepID=H2XZJ1_CIOIN|nr:transmembrane protein 60-like isoform X1 [Ciona intestinalis]XP_026694616.1 transmembrane protein 60-like isoform X2 [Ciona intestinalis]XP_026694617.1 transmembrane protein 60-like isoform X1 [Ciona intestinalis]|eukprot:XP_026694614.1 transmembrane protein 60-like isoform X1 [Ciona intestinalis]
MAFIIFAWFCSFAFLIMISMKLDERMQVSWFVVLVPLFVLSLVQLLYTTFKIILHIRRNRGMEIPLPRKWWSFAQYVLVAIFEILICLYLDNRVPGMKLSMALIPMWVFLIGNLIDMFRFQLMVVKFGRRRGSM